MSVMCVTKNDTLRVKLNRYLSLFIKYFSETSITYAATHCYYQSSDRMCHGSTDAIILCELPFKLYYFNSTVMHIKYEYSIIVNSYKIRLKDLISTKKLKNA